MILYIIRHGQTDWNVRMMLQGQSDTELNETGIKEARDRRSFFDTLRIDKVYSSPLSRALHTARIITEGRDIQIFTDDRLKEISFGINEGRLPGDRAAGTDLFFSDPDSYVPAEGGETIHELMERAKSFIEEVIIPISISDPDAHVLISGHGALDKALWLNLKHLPISEMWKGKGIRNLECAEFEINGSDFKEIHYFS